MKDPVMTENQISTAEAFGVKISYVQNMEHFKAYFTQAQDRFFVVDAILGTGIHLPLSQYLFEIIQCVNEQTSFTVSINVPSGVHPDTGRVSGSAIKADVTLVITKNISILISGR